MPAVDKKQTFAIHPAYTAIVPTWEKCRAAIIGEEAIKAGGIAFLPQAEGMDEAQYKAYKGRGVFYAATGRTVQGLTGMVLRKPPKIEYPDLEDLETIGPNDESLITMLKQSLDQVLSVGRVGFLVDAAQAEGQDGPTADTKPYVTQYIAENIINWHSQRVNGRFKLTLVVLQEFRASEPDTFGNVELEQIFRVLRFGSDPAVNDAGTELEPSFTSTDLENGFYYQEVWKNERDDKGKDTGKLIMESRVVPRKSHGRLWEHIPFLFLNAEDVTPDIGAPPLNAMIDVSLGHWRNSCDLEHGLHFVSLPTPWIFGDDGSNDMVIGSGVAWRSNNPDTKTGMLEFSGAGLAAIETAMTNKEGLMAVLGARLLEDQKSGVETAEALKIRLAGDGSVMSSISILTSRTWTTLLTWVQEWMATTTPDVLVELSLDFSPKRIDSAEMQALGQAVLQGLMSWKTYFYNLQQGEIIAPDWSEEEEMAAIQEGVQGGVEGSAAPGNEDADPEPEPDPEQDSDGQDTDPDEKAADSAESGVG